MKKLLVIALSAMMVLAFAAVSMAEVTFSGEIDPGYKSYTVNGGDTTSMPYIFGKVNMNGKLGNNLTGTMVIKSNDDPNAKTPATTLNNNMINNFQLDEADVTLTESFAALKFGYYGWNNNPKDIVDALRGDVKSALTSSASIKLGQNVNLGVAYAFNGTDNNAKAIDGAYGVDLGYATDKYGADFIYTNTSSYRTKGQATASYAPVMGVQGWYKVGDLKPFIQYETVSGDAYDKDTLLKQKDAPTNIIVGATYDSANSPVYARVEYDAAKENAEETNEMGLRVGYKLTSGAKVEAQHFVASNKDTQDYVKLICAF